MLAVAVAHNYVIIIHTNNIIYFVSSNKTVCHPAITCPAMFRSLSLHVVEFFFNVFIVCNQMFLFKNHKKRSSSTMSEEESSGEDEPWALHPAPKPGNPGAKGEKMNN